MNYGNVKVEQVNSKFEVVNDYGEILTKKELVKLLCNSFKSSNYIGECIYGDYNNNKYCIYFKNISYLGNPHPLFKKRIQIGDSFKTIYSQNEIKGITTLLVGVYSYKDTVMFVDFDTEKYSKRKAHNSSAHVYTIDLKNGLMHGIFQKIDANGNIVTVFSPSNVEKYLNSKFDNTIDLRLDFISVLEKFFACVPKIWKGKDCYQEMVHAKFNNALQPEWPGFYYEFKLNNFLIDNNFGEIIQYSQNKKKGDIDLDLYFPQINAYDDLKAHSNDSTGIQGNDWDTVMSVLEKTSIYYIVCNHDTEKDSAHNNEVTIFWNTLLNKKDLLSYAKKMKNSVTLTSFEVLEINKFNKKYLSVFEQGINSNGKPRAPKISIAKKNIKNFLIYSKNLIN